MKSAIFKSGQRIIKQILDWMQSGSQSDIQSRITDWAVPGVCQNTLNSWAIIPGTNNTALTPSVTVSTGVGYDANGNRIYIPDQTTAYDPSQPSHTTDNGLGTPVLTPRSTGSLNISLTTNSQNYVWVDYLARIDDSKFTLHKITNEKQYYYQEDGYQISVTTVNTPPTAASIFLGSINLTSGGVVNSTTIVQTAMPISRNQINRQNIKTGKADRSDRPSIYAIGDQTYDLQAHILATGNGTVSPNNPHGMTATDIGLTNTTIEEHQFYLHSNGIVGSTSTTTTSLYPFVTVVTPGLDFITVRRLTFGEVAIVNGFTLTNSDVNSDTIVNFSPLDANGAWYIYLDQLTRTILKTQANILATPDATKLLICSATWTYPGTGGGDLSLFVDQRVFGNVATREIQNQAVTPAKINQGVGVDFTFPRNTNVTAGKVQEQGNAIMPAGVILPFGGSSTPAGFFLCNGQAVSRTTYALLFAAIGTNWGSGDGSTTFNVPDTQGRFLRGTDNGTGRDPNRLTRTAISTGGATGDNVGSLEGAATKLPNSTFTTASSGSGTVSGTMTGSTDNSGAHQHTYAVLARTNGNQTGSNGCTWSPDNDANYPTGNSNANVNVGSNQGAHSHSVTTSGTLSGSVSTTGTVSGGGDAETRPINVNVNYIIKF